MPSRLRSFATEYASHAALNFGQTLHGLLHLTSHPTVDRVARRGSLKHRGLSLKLRTKRAANDFVFTLLPPHWHHTPAEIQTLHGTPLYRWFQYGYCAWRFDETGAEKPLTGNEDTRWDPRCDD